MKRMILIIISLSFLFNQSIIAQDDTTDILKEFERQKLSIEVIGQFSGSISPSLGIMSGSSYNKWIGYQGFRKVSESEFFKISGYEKESIEAFEYNETAKKELIGGAIAEAAGLIVYLIGITQKKEVPGKWIGDIYFPSYEEPNPNWPLVTIGAAATIGGIVYIFKGARKISRNWAPAQIAQSAAAEFNRKLKLKLGVE